MPANMKALIAGSFYDLTQKKPVDKITVKDLVESCGISRQTFYYHFQDILEVIEWTTEQAIQVSLEASLKAETPEEAMGVLIRATAREYRLIQKMLNSQKREFVDRLLVESVEKYLVGILRYKAADLTVNYADTEIALSFYAHAIVGVLLKYGGQQDLDPDRLAAQLCRLLPAGSAIGER